MGGKPVLPDELSNAHWQRHKGIVAKVVKGETGVGAALLKLQKVFDDVEWGYFDPRDATKMPKLRTTVALDERFEQAKSKMGQLTALRAEIFKVRDLCKKLGDKWEKSIIVPKATRVYVQVTMVKAAEKLAQEVKDIDETGYKVVRSEIARVEKVANDMFNGWVDRLEKVIPKAKSNPTVDFYNKNMHQQVRGLGTAISKMDKYKKLHKADDWNDLAGDNTMSGKTDGDEVKAQIEKVEKAFKKVKAAIG
jgi:hypothetical protein